MFWRVWDRSTKDGPIFSFKQLLAQLPQPQQPLFHPRLPLRPAVGHNLADSFRAGGSFWRNRGSAVQVLTKALQVHDLEWVGQHRSGLQAAGQIDVALARRLASKMPVKGMREAFESVMVGDMVVRRQTRHWQHHDGMCLCGLAQDTVDHVFWHCPRYAQHR